MTSAQYTTSATPHLTIVDCHDDLSIIGSTGNEVLIEIDDDSPATQIERSGESITITAMDSCDIACPSGVSITVEHVSGDLRVSELAGTLAIDTVNGDAALREIGPTEIKTVQGDLSIREVDGDLNIGTVRGDAKLKRISGQASVGQVYGDLVAQDLGSGAAFGDVSGDISFETTLQPKQTYAAKAKGDIIFRVAGGGAQFNLSSRSEIRSRLQTTNWQGNQRNATATLGDGSATVSLQADGDLLLLPASGGWNVDDFSDHVESMIESAMGQFESQMSRMQKDLEKRFGVQQAERARRAAERAKRHAERAAGSWGSFFASGRQAAAPPVEPISDAERLAVLKMVEDGKITADEAAKLLAAMEGST
jgi:hypothetical protein